METARSLMANLFGGDGRIRTCEVCGNEYDRCFEVRINGDTHIFDCFECAIHALAPRCVHCGCRIIGHGLEENGLFSCCAHCARQNSVRILENRTTHERSKI
jgi:hypothetical protein